MYEQNKMLRTPESVQFNIIPRDGILYRGIPSGIYWYTPRISFSSAIQCLHEKFNNQITLSVHLFYAQN